MTKLSTLLLFILFSFIFSSCSQKSTSGDSDTNPIGNWVRRADFDASPRSEAVSLVIGDTAYIGTGTDSIHYLKDFWKYDVINNSWVQRADLPGDGRTAAIAFSIGNMGYLGTGYNGHDRLKDFWQYNPSANQWTRKSDFAGTPRYDAIGFAINDKGYITTGNDGNALNDLYEYNPAADTAGTTTAWAAKPAMPGVKRSGGIAFVYKSKAYVCTGANGTDYSSVNDMWVFDPATSAWSAKRAISNQTADPYDDKYAIVRKNAVAFVIGDQGIISCGENGSNILKDTWQYDFVNDKWTQTTDWEGLERTGAVGFAARNRGFVTTGRNTKFYFDDLREFLPLDVYNVND